MKKALIGLAFSFTLAGCSQEIFVSNDFVAGARILDAAASKSSITYLGGTVTADGEDASLFLVVLKSAENIPVVGIVPVISATDTGSKNTYGCTPTDTNGESTCTLKSTKAEIKSVQLDYPVTLAGPAVEFVASTAAKLGFSTAPSSSSTMQKAFAVQPVVEIQDAFGNHVNASGSITLQAFTNSGCSTAPGTGEISNTTAVAVNGYANFSGLKFSVPGSIYLKASISDASLTAVCSSSPVQILGANSTYSSISGTTATADGVASSTITIVLKDEENLPIVGVVPTFSATNTGGSNEIGTCSPSSDSGVSTCSLKSLKAETKILTLTYPGSISTGTAILVGGPATQLVFTQQPGSNQTQNRSFVTAPTVQVLDQYDNLVGPSEPDATATITLTPFTNSNCTIAASGSFSQGSVSASAGLASFSSLSYSNAESNLYLKATLSGISVCSNAVQVLGPDQSQSSITGTSSIAADGSSQSIVTITIKSSAGFGIPGLTPTFTATDGRGDNSYGTCGLTNLSGVSTCTLSSSTAESKTLSLTSPLSKTGSSVTFIPGTASKVVFSIMPSGTATAGSAFSTQPQVIIQDANGNTTTSPNIAAGDSIQLSAFSDSACSVPRSGTLDSPNKTASGGVANFTGVSFTKSGTVYLKATDSSRSLTSDCSTAITVSPASAYQVEMVEGDLQDASVASKLLIDPKVRVVDQYGNGVSYQTVTFTVGAAGGSVSQSSVLTDSNGYASTEFTNGATKGTYSLTASASVSGSPNSYVFHATATSDVADRILLVEGDGQTAAAGTQVTTHPKVRVEDAYGNGVINQTVTFTVTSGGGSVSSSTVSTDTNGYASVEFTLGTTPGANALQASITGVSPSNAMVSFSATGITGPAYRLVLVEGDSQYATVGTKVSTNPKVRVEDQFGNPVESHTVTFAVATGGGSISAATVSSDSSGYASTEFTLGTLVGTNTLTASASVSSPSGSPIIFMATGTADVAYRLVLTEGNGQSATVGAQVSIHPKVKVEDAYGNGIPSQTVTFTVNSGGGSVSSPTGLTDENGYASTAYTLGTVAGSNSMSATAVVSSASDTVNFTATGTVGPGYRVVIAYGNGQSAQVGTKLPINPTVKVEDFYGNGVASKQVSFSVTGGGGSISAATATTDTSGFAHVEFTLGTTTGSNTLTASADVVATPSSLVTFTETATAGPAYRLVYMEGNLQTATVASILPTALKVKVEDQYGNGVPSYTVNYSTSTTGASLSASTPTTDSNGFATSILTLSTVAGENQVTASAVVSSTPSSIAFTATGTPGAAFQITKFSGDNQSGTVTTTLSTALKARVVDSYGNGVSSQTVNFTVGPQGGSVTPASIDTDADGYASATFTFGTVSGAYTILASATVSSATNSVTFNATGTAAAAHEMQYVSGDGQSATVNTAVASNPTVKVLDVYGNGVPSHSVTFTVKTGSGSVGTANATTNASGLASTTYTLGTIVGTNTMEASTTVTSGTVTYLFTETGTPGAATAIAYATEPSGSVYTTVAFSPAPSVKIVDAFGNTVTSDSTTLITLTGHATSACGGGGSALTNGSQTLSSGVTTFSSVSSTTAGVYYIKATNNGNGGNNFNICSLAAVTVTTPPAASISITSGNNQTVTAGSGVTTQVRVLNVLGTGFSGATVNFAVTSGGGSVSAASATTDATGYASVTFTTGTVVGTNTMTASTLIGGVTTTVTFTETGVAGAASKLAFSTSANANAIPNQTFQTSPVIQVQDANGNLVSSSSATVTLTLHTASNCSNGSTITITYSGATASSGVATISNLISTSASTGAVYLMATSGAMTSPCTSAGTIYAAMSWSAAPTFVAYSTGTASTGTYTVANGVPGITFQLIGTAYGSITSTGQTSTYTAPNSSVGLITDTLRATDGRGNILNTTIYVPGPILTFDDPTTYNFGAVGTNKTVDYAFTLRNTGNATKTSVPTAALSPAAASNCKNCIVIKTDACGGGNLASSGTCLITVSIKTDNTANTVVNPSTTLSVSGATNSATITGTK